MAPGKARRHSAPDLRKLHLAVDPATGEILASALTGNEEGDASLVGPLLDQITCPIGAVLADGVYDGEPVCLPAQKAEAKSACAVINRMTSLGMPTSRKVA